MLVAGYSMAYTARQLGVSANTVSTWSRQTGLGKARKQIEHPITVAAPIKLGDLISAYVATNLQTLTAITERLGDPAYIQERSVDELIAAIHAIGDWTVQILRTAAPASAGPEPELIPPERPEGWEEPEQWPPERG